MSTGFATDAMVARLSTEIEERTRFQDQLVEGAQTAGRDLSENEMQLYTDAAARIQACADQLGPLSEGVRIAAESAQRSTDLATAYSAARATNPAGGPAVEYRSAGAYILDAWNAAAGDEAARNRLTVYNRAAAHQTTADNLGVIPEPVVGGLINRVDNARPLVNALGPQAAAAGVFKRPRVTQHTDVAAQSAEKTELVSRKMLISSTPVSMVTYGGYVNVSRQNLDWSSPNIMDIVVNDLASEYAIETETVTCATLTTAAVAGPPALPATPSGADVASAIWAAAAQSYAAMHGAGSLILAVAPDMMGLVGPLFAPVNPSNAQSSGFNAGSFGSGPMGSISGITVVMSPALAAGTAIVVNTAAAEVYEQRIGTLSVTEPSVLGVQVAYAGYFAPVVLDAAGIIKALVAGP